MQQKRAFVLRAVTVFDILFAMDGFLNGELKGKVIIVTGANAGIGKATARQLAETVLPALEGRGLVADVVSAAQRRGDLRRWRNRAYTCQRVSLASA